MYFLPVSRGILHSRCNPQGVVRAEILVRVMVSGRREPELQRVGNQPPKKNNIVSRPAKSLLPLPLPFGTTP
eukprot:272347-Pleurochrysis_carterae.AAC.2